jgi:hypothetical protein
VASWHDTSSMLEPSSSIARIEPDHFIDEDLTCVSGFKAPNTTNLLPALICHPADLWLPGLDCLGGRAEPDRGGGLQRRAQDQRET